MSRNEDHNKRSLELDYLFEKGIDIKRRIIWIIGDITNSTYQFVDAAITELESASRSKITIRIMSGGGSVDSTRAIVGRIRSCKRRIVTEGYGVIMSAAVLILASGDDRRISKYAMVMHHESSIYDVEGRQSELEHMIKQSRFEEAQWAYWMSEFSNKSVQFWAELGTGYDQYLTPQDCLEFGIVDGIL